MNKKFSLYEFLAFSIILGCVAFMIIVFYIIEPHYSIADASGINISESSDIASLISNWVTPFFTLASVLLFYLALKYQRHDLNLQREEMSKTREEFEISRITDLILNQTDRIESLIDKMIIEGVTGHAAIERLGANLYPFETNILPVTPENTGSKIVNDSYDIVLKNIPFILKDLEAIFNFIMSVSNSVKIIISAIKSSSLSDSKKNELKNLLVQYIGEDKAKYFRWLSNSMNAYMYWYITNRYVPKANNYDQFVRLIAALDTIIDLSSKQVQDLEYGFN
ncbi:hypothetical protein [Flavobacterium sp. C4GT6]|uniref:hypothetical protein n=1 Tax=Flavobacterium sp. C4GT6 TaxID=3103818 RepID=UPI002ED5B031